MKILPVNAPFVMNSDPYPYCNSEVFPNNMYRRHQPRQRLNSIDMYALELISAVAPHLRPFGESDIAKENNDDDDVHIHVDMGLFAPEEITVKIINDHIVIEGKHEERQADDVGYVSRHFIRRYQLPKGYNPDDIVSKLSTDGLLRVIWPKITDTPNDRIIAVQRDCNTPITGDNDTIQNRSEEENKEQ